MVIIEAGAAIPYSFAGLRKRPVAPITLSSVLFIPELTGATLKFVGNWGHGEKARKTLGPEAYGGGDERMKSPSQASAVA